MNDELKARFERMLASPSLTVVPVGDVARADRGILTVADKGLGNLSKAVKATFSALVVAAALAAAPTPSHAAGVGYDASVYGQAQGQVMRQGAATRMTVLDVQPVKIEVAQQNNNAALRYAISGGSAAAGAVIGSQVGHTSTSHQLGGIVGGVIGVVAGQVANGMIDNSGQQVDGAVITMLNPANNQTAVITQAGGQSFAPGDSVLVVSMGGTARVIPDRGREIAQQAQPPARSMDYQGPATSMGRAPLMHGAQLEQTVASVMRSAAMMNLQVDPRQVAGVLETGVQRDGDFMGKITGVDPSRGVVYQSMGRGRGVVHPLASLDRVPQIGDVVTIQMRGGRGMVMEPGPDLAMGR